jgi:hypothetical protein
MSFHIVGQPNQNLPVAFTYLDQQKAVQFDEPFDALILEAVYEAVTEFQGANMDHEITSFLSRITERIRIYSLKNRPIYWNCVDESGRAALNEYCMNNHIDLPRLLREYCIRKDSKHLYNLSNTAVVELGGVYGNACVWNTARIARMIVSKMLPEALTHPNYGADVTPSIRAAIINPAITQGHDLLIAAGNGNDLCLDCFACYPQFVHDAYPSETEFEWDVEHHLTQLENI